MNNRAEGMIACSLVALTVSLQIKTCLSLGHGFLSASNTSADSLVGSATQKHTISTLKTHLSYSAQFSTSLHNGRQTDPEPPFVLQQVTMHSASAR